MKIALAGNPNSGKTTLFNAITGKTEYVGNWPGVTVDKKEANLKRAFKPMTAGHHHHHQGQGQGQGHHGAHGQAPGHGKNQVRVVDLPGAYSIAPFTSEEAIARDFILDEDPDVIINIIDATALERSLFFTTQLLELGIPMVIALNKQDLVLREGSKVNIEGLEKDLGCRVIETVAQDRTGLKELVKEAKLATLKDKQVSLEFEGIGSDDEDVARQTYIKTIINKYVIKKQPAHHITTGDKIDRVLASGIFGLPVFALIMWAIYSFSIGGLGGMVSDYFNETLFGEIVPNALNGFLDGVGVHPLLQALIVEGAIGGVGAVIGFIPLIMVLFFCLALLEDSGYMARVAVVMDRYFKRIGLSGKSIIPMIVGSGCSIPGVMAARTIEDETERKMTIMLTPFIPCSAKLPVIALFSAVFFPGETWVLPAAYVLAGVMIVVGGLILKRIYGYQGSSTFIIELPKYKVPNLRHALKAMFSQAKAFIVKASTIILVMNTLIWLLQTFNFKLQVVENPSTSMLALIGGLIAPLLIPLGFYGWQMAASALSGFIAKENVVATFAIILAVASEDALHSPNGPLTTLFNPVTAFAFLAFNLFTPPCFAAIGAMNSEIGSKKWLFRAIGFQMSVGYTVALIITQVGTMIVYGHLADGFIPAVGVLLALGGYLIYLVKRSDKERAVV